MAEELVCSDPGCRHARRMHSRGGCYYQLEKGQCYCKRTFMDKPRFEMGIPRQNWSDNIVSIQQLVGALTDANLKAGEVDAFLAETIPLLQNTVQDLADAIALNAGVLGDTSAESVSNALGFFQSAQNEIQSVLATLETAQSNLRAGTMQNEEYIGRLMS